MFQKLLERFIRGTGEEDGLRQREKYGSGAAVIGLGCNVALFLLKLVAGLFSGSIAVLADGFNNLSDAGSAVVSFIGFRVAAKPADKEHPFGHGRVEYISGLIVAFLIMFVGLQLFLTSMEKLIHPQDMTTGWLTPVLLVFSILAKIWMCAFYRAVGKRIESSTLLAAAQDSLNDVIATTAVLFSFLVFLVTEFSVDGFLGLGVSVFIFISGIKMVGETVSPLLGLAPDPALVKEIEGVIVGHDAITGVHDIVIHNYGPGRSIVTAHAEVPADADMRECHEVIDHIERTLTQRFQLEAAVLHMDPISTDDDDTVSVRAALLGQLNAIDPRLTIHDFRLVPCTRGMDVIFDVVLPTQFGYTDEAFTEELTKRMESIDPAFRLHIQIDRSYR